MRQRQITIFLIFAIIAAAGFLGYALSRPKANVLIRIVPVDAKLILDDQKIIRAGSLHVEPGIHTIKATRDGFSDDHQQFEIKQGTSAEVLFALAPNSKAGEDYVKNHPEEQADREEISGKRYGQSTSAIEKIYPIVKLLPHNGGDFSINYGQSRQDPTNRLKIALYIEVDTEAQKSKALNWIRYSGYNPDDYEIIYSYSDGRD